MSKKKANGALEDGALEQVAGGNEYFDKLKDKPDFDLEWLNSKTWHCELLKLMKETFGEEKSSELMNKYKTPSAMFDVE